MVFVPIENLEPVDPQPEKDDEETGSEKREKHWFKVYFGKWDDGAFDDKTSHVCIVAWTALHAAKKASLYYEAEEGEIITGVEYLGTPEL